MVNDILKITIGVMVIALFVVLIINIDTLGG